MKFNVIIPVRGRKEYLEVCLTSLVNAAKGKDVFIYVTTDDAVDIPYDLLNCDKLGGSMQVAVGYPPKFYQQFNKSYLINYALRMMRDDFDFVSIVDADMLYNPNFFDTIGKNKENDYFISGGYKLTNSSTNNLFHHVEADNNYIPYNNIPSSYIDEKLRRENDNQLYPSQITLSKYLYEKLLGILDTKMLYIIKTSRSQALYNEDFIGWGGEDSYLSFFSRNCEKKGLLNRIYNKDMWYHLWHPSVRESEEFDCVQHKKNVELLYLTDMMNKGKIEKYIKSIIR